MKLKATSLYVGDNGRITCGRLCCAGMTAASSGCDLSGRRLELITPPMAEVIEGLCDRPVSCETCGQTLVR